LRAAFLLVLPTLLCLGTEAAARSCHIQRFTFNYSSAGPSQAYMRVQSGKSCGSRSWSTGGIFKGLYLASGARHGRVTLAFPGTYRYFPSPGYVGDDRFTLKICGTGSTGAEGCSDIVFSVSVVPGGV
jgi:hypothetical protein